MFRKISVLASITLSCLLATTVDAQSRSEIVSRRFGDLLTINFSSANSVIIDAPRVIGASDVTPSDLADGSPYRVIQLLVSPSSL
jgi:hypothetical protein